MLYTFTGIPEYGTITKTVKQVSYSFDHSKPEVKVDVDALLIPDPDGDMNAIRFFGDIEGTTLHLYSKNRKKVRSYDLTKPHTFLMRKNSICVHEIVRVW